MTYSPSKANYRSLGLLMSIYGSRPSCVFTCAKEQVSLCSGTYAPSLDATNTVSGAFWGRGDDDDSFHSNYSDTHPQL